ncbi:WD40 repeat-like protein [Corynespora cassiicola Philippines]|uniref:WD40 repeat-like protein n=1 Tax=Corynespora cassiicola Philippines TaxID=1448308 RepID=A0A2T2NPZ9_CORCC|nr:WD40 repeat-like protein [Corynespora cassiicola Philippines]
MRTTPRWRWRLLRRQQSQRRDPKPLPKNGTGPATPLSSQKGKKTPQINGEDEKASTPNTNADAKAPASTPAKTPGKRGKKNKQNVEADSAGADQDDNASKALVTVNGDVVGKTPKKQDKKQKTKPKWSVSEPFGGWFLSQDPVFSRDEKHIVLANLRSLQIYSVETSLLEKELPIGSSGVSLTAYALSSTKPNHVYTADSSGLITLWDWTDGSKIGRWDIDANVRHLEVVTQPGTEQDLVFSHEAGNSHVVNVHALRTKSQASQTDLKRVVKSGNPISGFQVFAEGRVVVVASSYSIMIGKRTKLQKTALQEFEYTWREFKMPKRITAFNAYIREPEISVKGDKAVGDHKDHLDLAVGDESGVIHLFEDILTSFAAIEKSQKNRDSKDKSTQLDSLRPKRLHWHRTAVGSVKWSRDGNYLISGGDETVLVMWQLSTGKEQTLPHLTAAIENIVVSPLGAAYAVSLANNSVIVLSTSELQAKSNIIGLQSRRVDLEQLPKESPSANYSFDIFNKVPMVVDPKSKNHIIASIPSSQPRHHNAGVLPEPYLQTFDIANHRPVARQALTRNNATDPNMGPEGTRIREPSITHVQISHDGKWLATVDEWIPPRSDMTFLDEGIPEFNEEERTFRREVYLKFWQWDETANQWNLETRIDAPHFFEELSACGRVLDLVADPAGPGFATVGEDHYVRIWRPKTRLRDGVTVRGADKSKGLITWSLDRSVNVGDKLDDLEENANSSDVLAVRNSQLSFSEDGSALAVGVSWISDSDPGVLHVIDVEAGAIRRSITEVNVSDLAAVGIVGHHLVIVATALTVWDLIQDQLAYSMPIDTPGIDSFSRVPLVRFAVNPADGTFAVSLPHFEKKEFSSSRETRRFKRASSKVSIYEPVQAKAVWSSKVPGIALALSAAKGEKGYLILDSSSCVRIISPKGATFQLPSPLPETTVQTITDSMDVDEEAEVEIKEQSATLGLSLDALTESQENDKPVVRPEQLQQIFDVGPSHALPPVKDLFNAVVGLYARKPRHIAGAA